MTREDLLRLIDKYLADEASPEEISQLKSYYSAFQQDQLWNEKEMGDKSEIEKRMLLTITGKIGVVEKRRFFSLGNMKRVAVAASIIMVLGLGAYFYLDRTKHNSLSIVTQKPVRFKNDILPGGDKAVLILADGSSILLDDAQDGTLAQQGSTKVIKTGGKVSYNAADKNLPQAGYNTISTPRGGQYQVQLPDGTIVWLNAESSVKFPTAFSGNKRQVEINGEAYFEVTHNSRMPFIVKLKEAEIEVLGTHFNVMAYSDEDALKTTLLEGSIKFTNGTTESLLSPGQQSQMNKAGEIKLINDVDMEQTVAWKNGYFVFDNYSLQTVMRQLSRWYDVSVEYQNQHDKSLFVGEMARSSKLSDVLKVLELTGNIQFGIEGKKIIVQ